MAGNYYEVLTVKSSKVGKTSVNSIPYITVSVWIKGNEGEIHLAHWTGFYSKKAEKYLRFGLVALGLNVSVNTLLQMTGKSASNFFTVPAGLKVELSEENKHFIKNFIINGEKR